MNLRIITQEREILNTEAESVTLPGTLGQMQILTGHTKLLSTLKSGNVRYQLHGNSQEIAVGGGLAEVFQNNIVVLAKSRA